MHIHENQWGPAPGLLVSRDQPHDAAAKGTVLFFHGFSVDCSVNQRELVSLAERGFLAVGLDNAGHGRRRDPHWDTKFGPGGDWQRHFRDLVQQSAAEIPTILDALADQGLLPNGNAGIVGISMGGLICYEAIPLDPRIVSATPMIATPKYVADRHADFYPTAILSQTAGKDAVIDWRDAAAFHEKLAPAYQADPHRQQWRNFPDSEHTMRETDWHQAWANVLDWHGTHLA